jgi:hypothetical protein
MGKHDSLKKFLETQASKEKELKEKAKKQSKLQDEKFAEFIKARKNAFTTIIIPTMQELDTLFEEQGHLIKIVPETSLSTYDLLWNGIPTHYFTITFVADPEKFGIWLKITHISSPSVKLSNLFFPFTGFTSANELTSKNISQEITKGIQKYWAAL